MTCRRCTPRLVWRLFNLLIETKSTTSQKAINFWKGVQAEISKCTSAQTLKKKGLKKLKTNRIGLLSAKSRKTRLICEYRLETIFARAKESQLI